MPASAALAHLLSGFPLVMMAHVGRCCWQTPRPDQDYPEASPEFQWVRGPYSITTGIAAYQRYLRLQGHRAQATRAGMLTDAG